METEGVSQEILIWSDLVDDHELRVMPRTREQRALLNICTGYHRPVKNWNKGKQEEFKDRKTYNAGQASAIVARTPPRQPDMEEAETVAVAV